MRATAYHRSAGLNLRTTDHERVVAPVVRDGRASRHWTINGDFLALKPNGVARHARETVRALDALVRQRHPLTEGLSLEIVAPRPPDPDFGLDAIPIRVVQEYARPRLPQFWVQCQLPFQVRGGLLSFCNLAPVSVARQIVCIHDLHTFIVPDSYGLGFRWAHSVVLPILGRRARRIATVSLHSRDTIAAYGIAPADKISVVYNGCDHAERWAEAEPASATQQGRPFVLCLGQPQSYKNLDLALTLAGTLEELGLDLAVAGNVGEDYVAGVLGHVPANVRLLGRVSDAELARAFREAFCFLFPSGIEGFGLPAVEAMLHGCPVIASQAAAIPEICGNGALYADADDPDQWRRALARLVRYPALRASLAENGRKRAAIYTWQGVAKRYLNLMATVDAEAAQTEMKPN